MAIIKNSISIILIIVFIFPAFAEKRKPPHLTLEDLTDPSSPSFVPYPFPQTDEEIIEDLKAQLKRIYNQKNRFKFSINDDIIDILPGFIKENPSVEVERIVKVKNRISRMSEDYSYLMILHDKKSKHNARIVLKANGLYLGGASPSKSKPVKKLKTEKDIINIVARYKGSSFKKKNILKIELIAFGIGFANPMCPIFQVNMNDGSVLYVDYHDRFFLKSDEKKLKGDKRKFINLERMKIKRSDRAVYDSISDKIIILKNLKQAN